MPKFFVTQDKISDNQIIIDSEDVTHISRVLRLEKGDNVTVCDGQGTDYDAQIDTIEPKKILLNIISRQKSETEPNIKVTLFQALPKASKMEYIIQKTTELGISEIVPVKLSRCVVKIDNKKYKQHFHAKAKMIPFEEVEEYTGHAPGGVCPFAVREGVRAYLDESLKRFETVYPAAGSANSAVRLTPQELEQCIENVTWIDVCK